MMSSAAAASVICCAEMACFNHAVQATFIMTSETFCIMLQNPTCVQLGTGIKLSDTFTYEGSQRFLRLHLEYRR